MNRFGSALRDGLRQFADHPQLWLTVLVACTIFGSFVYVAYRFSSIAQEAHERLINVRIGSLQDAFVPLAATLIKDRDQLRAHMTEIVSNNETIKDFYIAAHENEQWIKTLSIEPESEGETLVGYDLLFSLAESNPRSSFTIEDSRSSERFYITVRSVSPPATATGSSTRAMIVTRQTLSAADQQIAASIRDSIFVLIAILFVLLFLFFRHARIIDYAVLYKRLQDVDRMKDDFISMASHELRTPLTAIRGYADILKTSTNPKNTEETVALERIDISARSLDTLVQDILDVARIQEGRLKYNIQEINPRSVIAAVCETLQPMAAQKHLSLLVEAHEGPRIRVDVDRLRQILMNIVGNAIKYTMKGEVRIETRAEEKKYILRISDTGLGMNAEDQKHMFEKFYRSPGREVRSQQGTGLGLWITKQMVEAMGGTISVESIEGVGSHFIISFPLASY